MDKYFNSAVEEALQAEISEVGDPVSFEVGEQIMKSNQYTGSFPMVLSGCVKLIRESEKGDEILMYYVSAKQRPTVSLLFTLVSPSSTNIVKAIAKDPTNCLLVPIDAFISWLSKYSSWKSLVLEDYLYHHDKMMGVFDQVAFTKIDRRIELYLYEKKNFSDSMILDITHQEIANDLNTSRETVSRLLKRLEEKGKIELSRNKIKILKKN